MHFKPFKDCLDNYHDRSIKNHPMTPECTEIDIFITHSSTLIPRSSLHCIVLKFVYNYSSVFLPTTNYQLSSLLIPHSSPLTPHFYSLVKHIPEMGEEIA